jgi:opacity protein-like surface antigen
MRRIELVAIGSLVMSGTALAADLPPRLPPLPPVVQAAPEPVSSGWYFRGDAGYRFNGAGSVSSAIAPDPTNNRINDAFAIGMGAGYKWSWFRTDLTIDYAFSANYRGDTPGFSPDFSAKIQSATGLANFYVDLGTWSGLTPYIGGGLGGAYVRTSAFSSASLPTLEVSSDRWNFAWAAMAGIAYCFTQNFLVDVGYRYLDQGHVSTGMTTLGDQLTLKNLTAHEVRAGVRWSL